MLIAQWILEITGILGLKYEIVLFCNVTMTHSTGLCLFLDTKNFMPPPNPQRSCHMFMGGQD